MSYSSIVVTGPAANGEITVDVVGMAPERANWLMAQGTCGLYSCDTGKLVFNGNQSASGEYVRDIGNKPEMRFVFPKMRNKLPSTPGTYVYKFSAYYYTSEYTHVGLVGPEETREGWSNVITVPEASG
jgi:hypothetical protein